MSSQLDLLALAYLSLPPRPGDKPRLISNYPAPWTARYLEHQYQSIDPVIVRARVGGCPFRWTLHYRVLSHQKLSRGCLTKPRSSASVVV